MTRITTVEDRIDRLERKLNLLLWLSIAGIIIKIIFH